MVIFALAARDVADCAALYDRAALIALPPSMRERYAVHLQQILPAELRGLLITLDYDQAQLPGPPFAVADDEVQRLLGRAWRTQELQEQDVLGEGGKFLQAGVTRLVERVYRISLVSFALTVPTTSRARRPLRTNKKGPHRCGPFCYCAGRINRDDAARRYALPAAGGS